MICIRFPIHSWKWRRRSGWRSSTVSTRKHAGTIRASKTLMASFNTEYKIVMVATSEGTLIGDVQPLSRLQVTCIAEEHGNRQIGSFGGGGRIGFEFYRERDRYLDYAKEAARIAILNLSSVDAPAGVMPVVLGGGWPGILLHEAIGHGLEADFNRKKTSAFSNLDRQTGSLRGLYHRG